MGARRAATPPAELRRKAAELDEYAELLLAQVPDAPSLDDVNSAHRLPVPVTPVLADRLAFLQEWAAELRVEANGES